MFGYDITELADPSVLPHKEMCKGCQWECCLTLLQSQRCSHRGGEVVETVVYMDAAKKEVVEIRFPQNYLRMKNEEYQCNHSLYQCTHSPKHECGFPHYKVEEDIWNVWKRTASANMQFRPLSAVSWSKEVFSHFCCHLQINMLGLLLIL